VTTTLSQKGQVVIPQQVRSKLHLQPGDDFIVLSSQNGDILLRPVKKTKRRQGLVETLQALHGLAWERSDDLGRDVAL
jgi:AbrB family looped-hinge helix DNA binding protein